jgi:flagellar biosynthetic protein FliP
MKMKRINRILKSGISFAVLIILVIAALTMTVSAEPPVIDPPVNEAPAPEVSPESSALYDLIGIDASQPLEILILITIISVAPSILLMMTSFTRIIIVFGFMRNAMSTQSTPPNQVLVGLALFLTMFIMWPVFAEINRDAFQPYRNGDVDAWGAVALATEPMKKFMLSNTTNDNMSFFLDLAEVTLFEYDGEGNRVEILPVDRLNIDMTNYQDQLSLRVVIPAFMISELSRAFQMGFLLFIPFLIIDLVVASTLMSMGMMMLPPAMISMPFKIMLFVLVNGWQMLVGSVIGSFNWG